MRDTLQIPGRVWKFLMTRTLGNLIDWQNY